MQDVALAEPRARRVGRDPMEAAIARALEPLARAPGEARDLAVALGALCARGGKRIRPRLCVLGYQGTAGRAAPAGVYAFAAGIEILHAFMLVHDDLIDDADVRRGGPAVHRLLARPGAPAGQPRDLAMLGGDLLFALAMEAMSRARLPAALARRATSAVLESARDAAVGEYLDVVYAARPVGELTSAELAEVLRLKTARYTFEAPLVAGAILGRAGEKTRASLAAFGSRVGVAFQLADDLLDLYGDARALGKPTGGDVRQRKRTILVRLAHERAAPGERARLAGLMDAGGATDGDVAWVAALARRTGVAAEVVARVDALVRGAARSLEKSDVAPAVKGALLALAGEVYESVKHAGEGAG